ncbi:MAG: 30S ribosome-binding factor RbfA [bacterium]
MSEVRMQRIQEAYKEELSELIQRQLKDPRIGFVSITDVNITSDLRQAKVYVSVFGNEEAKKRTMAGLERARNYLRLEIGRRIRLRYTPELIFVLDESIEKGVHLKELLDRLEQEESEGADLGGGRDKKDS